MLFLLCGRSVSVMANGTGMEPQPHRKRRRRWRFGLSSFRQFVVRMEPKSITIPDLSDVPLEIGTDAFVGQ
ncbi:MAG: hypothetical protein K2X38_17265 [Gemmataceae bacterium]|nr:hypothetical protein [Gemmataceae bacterium]